MRSKRELVTRDESDRDRMVCIFWGGFKIVLWVD